MEERAKLAVSKAEVYVTLHGEQNVILKFSDEHGDGEDEPVVWGFATIADFRTFLKALVRFDEKLGGGS